MSGFTSKTTGWLAMAIGITSIIGFTLLFIFLTGYFSNQSQLNKFGNYSDIAGVFPPILTAILATTIHPTQRSHLLKLSPFLLTGVWVGAFLITYGGWLIVTGTGALVMQGSYHSFGYSLIGLWVLTLNLIAKKNSLLPAGLTRLGLFSGIIMLVGLVGFYGIIFGIDGNTPTPFLIITAGISFIGHGILFPIWNFWLGIRILTNSTIK